MRQRKKGEGRWEVRWRGGAAAGAGRVGESHFVVGVDADARIEQTLDLGQIAVSARIEQTLDLGQIAVSGRLPQLALALISGCFLT